MAGRSWSAVTDTQFKARWRWRYLAEARHGRTARRRVSPTTSSSSTGSSSATPDSRWLSALLALVIALLARSRAGPALWLLGPAELAYLAALLIDWPWHVPASAALFALVAGGLAAGG